MSGGLLVSHCVKTLADYGISGRLRAQMLPLLCGVDDGFTQFIYEAGLGAGLGRRRLLIRGAAIVAESAAIQLADDLSDGECSYLRNPWRDGPLLLALMQIVFHRLLAASGLRARTVQNVLHRLTCVADTQYGELHTRRWDLLQSKAAAIGLNGMQVSAYFEILWAGTRFSAVAHQVGCDLGTALHVATDMRSRDRRYRELPAQERRALVAHAVRCVDTAEKSCPESLVPFCISLRRALRGRPAALHAKY